ncbi:hypothetical protein PQX77_020086 [Marasmius sp. AFHP31]|nr:hypothetical protein PQX77_020086 [Marasmius sp. AFHP31]
MPLDQNLRLGSSIHSDLTNNVQAMTRQWLYLVIEPNYQHDRSIVRHHKLGPGLYSDIFATVAPLSGIVRFNSTDTHLASIFRCLTQIEGTPNIIAPSPEFLGHIRRIGKF